MVSTRQSSRAEQVASNAWGEADGGFIFADAPNAVTSAAVIIHQISMHRNITPLRVTRLSRVSSRASGGFTTGADWENHMGWVARGGFPCGGQTSSFDVTFPLAASVREVRFGEAQKVIWERTHD